MSVICGTCHKSFSARSTLIRHIREVHKVSELPDSMFLRKHLFNYRCLEEDCDSAFSANKMLIEHLEEVHSKEFKTETFEMKNLNDFDEWKSNMENSCNCYYVVKSKYSASYGEITYYYCNRSRTSYSCKTSKRNRSSKSKGSCKMSNSCTSQIKVINNKDTCKIHVEWLKTHYGHNSDLEHIRLTKIEKKNIALKLINGETPKRILESKFKNPKDGDLSRIDLLTSKDIYNIRTKLSKYEKRNSINNSSDFDYDDKLMDEGATSPIEQSCSEREKLVTDINFVVSRLEEVEYHKLEDPILSKLHHHLMIINELSICTKRKQVEENNSQNRTTDKKDFIIQESSENSSENPIIFEFV